MSPPSSTRPWPASLPSAPHRPPSARPPAAQLPRGARPAHRTSARPGAAARPRDRHTRAPLGVVDLEARPGPTAARGHRSHLHPAGLAPRPAATFTPGTMGGFAPLEARYRRVAGVSHLYWCNSPRVLSGHEGASHPNSRPCAAPPSDSPSPPDPAPPLALEFDPPAHHRFTQPQIPSHRRDRRPRIQHQTRDITTILRRKTTTSSHNRHLTGRRHTHPLNEVSTTPA